MRAVGRLAAFALVAGVASTLAGGAAAAPAPPATPAPATAAVPRLDLDVELDPGTRRLRAVAHVVPQVRDFRFALHEAQQPTAVTTGGKALSFDAIEGGVQLCIEVTVELEGKSKPVCVAESMTRQYR